MAKKNYAQEKLKMEKQKKYEAAKKKLVIFPWLALAFSLTTLLLMFVDWAAVYNTDMAGNEVKFTGFNCLFAALGGDYTGTAKILGDIAVPFNYYAKTQTHVLGLLTIFAFVVLIANIVVRVIAGVTNKRGANIVTGILTLVETGLFVACFAIALSMKDAEILSGYCQNNPACSIQSRAIVPAVSSFLSLSMPILALIGYKRAENLMK